MTAHWITSIFWLSGIFAWYQALVIGHKTKVMMVRQACPTLNLDIVFVYVLNYWQQYPTFTNFNILLIIVMTMLQLSSIQIVLDWIARAIDCTHHETARKQRKQHRVCNPHSPSGIRPPLRIVHDTKSGIIDWLRDETKTLLSLWH